MQQNPLDNKESYIDVEFIQEISVIPFRYKQLKPLIELLRSNNFPDVNLVSMKTLPKCGYMAFLSKQPIAAGFLRKLEGGYGQIDTLTSYKYAGSIVRHEGISRVVDCLLFDAKKMKLRGVMAFTDDAAVVKRAQTLGFTLTNHVIISLKL